MRLAHAIVSLSLAAAGCAPKPSPSVASPDAAPPAAESTDTLQVGSAAPPFSLQAHDGSSFALHDALTKGPVVVVFYRGHW